MLNTHLRDNFNHIKTVGNLIYFEEAAISSSLTLSTTENDVAGCTHTFTTTIANAKYVAWATFLVLVGSSSAGQVVRGKINVDGSTLSGTQAYWKDNGANSDSMVTQVWEGALASTGSHTIKLRAVKDSSSGTHTVSTPHTKIAVAVYE